MKAATDETLNAGKKASTSGLKPGALSKCALLAKREEKQAKAGSPATGEKAKKTMSKCERLYHAEQREEFRKVRHDLLALAPTTRTALGLVLTRP